MFEFSDSVVGQSLQRPSIDSVKIGEWRDEQLVTQNIFDTDSVSDPNVEIQDRHSG